MNSNSTPTRGTNASRVPLLSPSSCANADPLRLALRPKEAAEALGIGKRLLWSKTNAGEIPCVHIGRAIVYPVDLLRTWLADQAKRGGR